MHARRREELCGTCGLPLYVGNFRVSISPKMVAILASMVHDGTNVD